MNHAVEECILSIQLSQKSVIEVAEHPELDWNGRMLAEAKEWLQRRLSQLKQLSTEYSQSYGEAALQDFLKTLDSLGYEPGWLTKTLQEARQMSPASTDPE